VINTIHVRATRAAIRQALSKVPTEATGGGAAVEAMLMRMGLALLGRIKRAFVAKARGGTDEAGDSWQPLSPRTVAYSRRGRSKAEKKRAARPSQALTAQQQEWWWRVYRRALAAFRGDKGHAAAQAWWVLKKLGATTLLEKYGGRRVEILRDTGLLLNSLSPGYGGPEQVLRTGRGEVVVGTNRKGAAAHHEGVPGRLPQRRLWPEPSRWPASWWRDILEAARGGLIDLTLSVIRHQGG
jgi:hypothetical protein